MSESLLKCSYRHHTIASIVNHNKLLLQLHGTIKLFNLYVYLLNPVGIQWAQCLSVQASKGVAARQPDGSDLRLMQIKSNQIKFISHKYRNDIYTNTACIYLWAVNQKSRSLSSWLPWHGKKAHKRHNSTPSLSSSSSPSTSTTTTTTA